MKHITPFFVFAFLFSVTPALAARTAPQASPAVRVTQSQQELQNEGESQVNKPNVTGTSQMVQNRTQVCQSMEAAIKTRSQNMNQFSYKVIEALGTMTNRVQDYYQKQLATQAATRVQNYASLSSQVQTKKNAAIAAQTKAQNSLLNFNCNSEKPAEALKEYNANMLKVKTALQEYKDSVNQLSVAVKTAAQKGGQQ
jgi:hypothetical protein